MKTFIFLFMILFQSCSESQDKVSPILQQKESLVNGDVCHFALLNATGEKLMGDMHYVLILKSTYKTDGTQQTIISNIQHEADFCNGLAQQDQANFPYVKYQFIRSKWLTCVYLSVRNIPTKTEAVKAWMIDIAAQYHSNNMLVDSMEVHPIDYIKIAWSSTELKQ